MVEIITPEKLKGDYTLDMIEYFKKSNNNDNGLMG